MSDIVPIPVPLRVAPTPDFNIKIETKDKTEDIRPRLISLKLTDNRGLEVDQLDLVLDDSDGQLVMPPFGAKVVLDIGWKGQPLANKGSYIIDQVTYQGAPDTITVVARSADFSGSLDVKITDSYPDMTVGEVVEKIAKRNGLTSDVRPEIDKKKIKHIDQTQETDGTFITRLAMLVGAVAAIKDKTLLFFAPGHGVTASGKPIPLLNLNRQDGDKYEYKLFKRDDYSGVEAKWYDQKKAQQKGVTVNTIPPATPAVNPVHPAAKNIPTIGQQDPGKTYVFGSNKKLFVLNTHFSSQGEAEEAAKAKWQELQRNRATLKILLALGAAELIPETPVKAQGFKSVIDNQKWLITNIVHTLDKSGFTTQLNLELMIESVDYVLVEKQAG
ncbi:contractile injection system protein, VgrG/Pvc8 family [Pantoea allii]|uniref:contractile injection system protein, VgrG/Pvc8 family n=1 Tax=Pantoea allii TaxID=574096 RepID=UPI003D31F8D2